MFTKKLTVLVIAFLLTQSTFSQKIMQSLGGTISVLYGTNNQDYSSSSFTLVQTNFTYFPRYNFVERENSSISVGIPVGFGIGIANDAYGDEGIAVAYDLPIVVDYNIGCNSTWKNDKNFGGYFGLGFGYYKVSISQTDYSDFTGATYGPMIRAGMRFGNSITTGMFYKKGLESDKYSTIGFNILYDLD